MSDHASVLKQLCPIAFGGDYAAEVAIEGAYLDAASLSAENMLPEFFPDTCNLLLSEWERVFGLVGGSAGETERRQKLVAKVRERGGLSIEYFVGLAASLGATITVEEGDLGDPFRAGLSAAGDAVYGIEEQWRWTVIVHGKSGPELVLEALLTDLAPAWTEVSFEYVM